MVLWGQPILLSHELSLLSLTCFLVLLYLTLSFSLLPLLNNTSLLLNSFFLAHHLHDLFVDLDDWQRVSYLNYISHLVLSLKVTLLLLDHGLRNRTGKVTSDPWVHQSDVSVIPIGGFSLTQFDDERLSHFTYLGMWSLKQFVYIEQVQLSLVLLFGQTFVTNGMLTCQHFIHDEATCPQVSWFAILRTADQCLLRALVY